MLNELGDLLCNSDGYKLPQQSHGICYWGGDGGGGGSTDGAAGYIENYSTLALNAQRDAAEKASHAVAPWRTAGEGAVNQISGLLGLPGYTALDPTKTLEGTPGYQFLRDQGTEALRRYGAGTGLLSSGAGMKGALDYGNKLAQTYAWQPYMSSLQNLSGQGLQAGTSTGGWDMTAGMGQANTYMTTGQQLAQLEMQKQQMKAQQESGENGWFNDIMSGVGFGASLIAAPFTGGTSLIGALGTGAKLLGGAFGGGGGGASGLSAYNPSTSAYGDFGLGSSLGFMADGGPTNANRPYIVGERGPELFVPNVPGYVIPNEYTQYSAFRQPYRRAA